MKKLAYVLSIVLLAAGISACSSNVSDNNGRVCPPGQTNKAACNRDAGRTSI